MLPMLFPLSMHYDEEELHELIFDYCQFCGRKNAGGYRYWCGYCEDGEYYDGPVDENKWPIHEISSEYYRTHPVGHPLYGGFRAILKRHKTEIEEHPDLDNRIMIIFADHNGYGMPEEISDEEIARFIQGIAFLYSGEFKLINDMVIKK